MQRMRMFVRIRELFEEHKLLHRKAKHSYVTHAQTSTSKVPRSSLERSTVSSLATSIGYSEQSNSSSSNHPNVQLHLVFHPQDLHSFKFGRHHQETDLHHLPPNVSSSILSTSFLTVESLAALVGSSGQSDSSSPKSAECPAPSSTSPMEFFAAFNLEHIFRKPICNSIFSFIILREKKRRCTCAVLHHISWCYSSSRTLL